MLINIIGECDKRPVLYTIMKVAQTLGDVLLVSSSKRVLRLSDTRDSGGHYQNTMICTTDGGIDDFLESFEYSIRDFEYIIVDNIVAPDADVYIYVEGYERSEFEEDMLEYIEDYSTIPLYKNKLLAADTMYRLERFESLGDMAPISKVLATEVAKVLAPKIGTTVDTVVKIAMEYKTAASKEKPQPKGPTKTK